VGPSLREAIVKNPYMKLFVAMAYFDLATPFYAAEYTLDHLGLNSKLHANISTGYFDAEHRVYIDSALLSQLKQDVSVFMSRALAESSRHISRVVAGTAGIRTASPGFECF
jgi:carboxypeptidase C (cathepsin A)